MKIKDLEIHGFAALAPMAGVADRAMREMCMAYGAAFCVGELTSAKGVSLGDKKSKQLLSCSPAQRPMGTQLFGADPATMAEAARIAESFGPDFLDLNMGCPAPKVVKNGGGAALMQDPKKAGEIIKAVVNAVSLPVTVKMRTGWEAGSENCVTLAKIAEQNGAAAVTVHGRTRQQMYAPGVNNKAIAAVKKAVSIPVIANGDIATAANAAAMLERTGCDLVMVGRGAQGNPWVFRDIASKLAGGSGYAGPTPAEKMALATRHAKLLSERSGKNIVRMRKHAMWYMAGLPGASAARARINLCTTLEDFNEVFDELLEKTKQHQMMQASKEGALI